MVSLPWSDLEPRTHPYDGARVRAEIAAVVRTHAASFGRANAPRAAIQTELDRAILHSAGSWACGWRWSPSEPGGGGPTHGWCCERDSVFRDDDANAAATADRAYAALLDWRAYLEKLDLMFAMLRVQTASLPVAKEVEIAASRLLSLVVERTGAEDAWYNTFARALSWYLEAAGMADDDARAAVALAIEGRFESWIAPDEAGGRAICAELAAGVAERAGDELRDALGDWRVVRAHPITLAPGFRAPATIDAHDDYIVLHDLARDLDRAERMAAALVVCRDSAARGMPLTFDQLAEWQRIVLGTREPVPFRTTDAFAKEGRECYRFSPELRDAFDHALAEATDPALDVAIRAARVYLDVCFFHPFADGNSRAARLALDHVLTSAGLTLLVAEPIFALSRAADDPDGLWHLARVISHSLATRARDT